MVNWFISPLTNYLPFCEFATNFMKAFSIIRIFLQSSINGSHISDSISFLLKHFDNHDFVS